MVSGLSSGLRTLCSKAALSRLLIASLAVLLAACDIPGMGTDPRVAQREAEGKAVGGACRYALRGIEECYQLNPKSPKTAIFDGWREMDQYMRDNKIEGQAPPPESRGVAEGATSAEKTPATEGKNGNKAGEKAADKKPPTGEAKARGS